jgi:hypothetical protein
MARSSRRAPHDAEESKIEEVFSLQGGSIFLLATGKQILFLQAGEGEQI